MRINSGSNVSDGPQLQKGQNQDDCRRKNENRSKPRMASRTGRQIVGGVLQQSIRLFLQTVQHAFTGRIHLVLRHTQKRPKGSAQEFSKALLVASHLLSPIQSRTSLLRRTRDRNSLMAIVPRETPSNLAISASVCPWMYRNI